MQLLITIPLKIKNRVSGTRYDLLPVHMNNAIPSSNSELWLRFLVKGGKSIPLSRDDADRVQQYMRQHGFEALSEDGQTAFTLAGERLVECDTSVCSDRLPDLYDDLFETASETDGAFAASQMAH